MSRRCSLALEGLDDASIAQLDDFDEEFYGTGGTSESGEESHDSSSDDEPAAKEIRYSTKRTPCRPSGVTASSGESGAESDDGEESDRDSELEYSASGEGASFSSSFEHQLAGLVEAEVRDLREIGCKCSCNHYADVPQSALCELIMSIRQTEKRD